MSDYSEDILRQLDFYFGNANFVKDKFLREKFEENNERVPVDIVLSFSNMKKLEATLEQCKKAAEKSEVFDIVEDKFFVRRQPFEEYDPAPNTIILKNLPEDLRDIRSVENIFNELENPSIYVRVREQAKKGIWIGHVEFNCQADAEKAMEFVRSKYETIEVLTHDEYEKSKEQNAAKEQKNAVKPFEEFEYTKGTVLMIENLPEGNNLTRDEIKEFYTKYGRISFVQFNSGDVNAEIRFAHDAPAAATTVATEKPEFAGATLKYRVLEGEEEVNYFHSIYQASLLKRVNRSNGRNHFRNRKNRRQ